MVLDLGAPHDTIGTNGHGSVDLDSLDGLKIGKDYPFDFFYCERKSTESYIEISTSLKLKCKYQDYCGVCEGDGSSCCNAEDNCDDYNPCTIDKCPPPLTKRSKGQSIDEICIHEPIQCNSTACGEYACNRKSGQCELVSEKLCTYKDSCQIGKCQEKFGGCTYDSIKCLDNPLCSVGQCMNGTCHYTPITCEDNNKCTIDECNDKIGCTHRLLDCNDHDHCTTDSCHKDKGCVHTPISHCIPCSNSTKCETKNPCVNIECDPEAIGKCVSKPVVCDDLNKCTNNQCEVDPKTNQPFCKFTPIECPQTSLCEITYCNSTLGKCQSIPMSCDDSNPCTIDFCVDGQCEHVLDACDDGDKCTVDQCIVDKGGCVNSPLDCRASFNSSDICTEFTCDSQLGCIPTPKICPQSERFCEISQCDIVAGGCIYYNKTCITDNPDCEYGQCIEESRSCETKSYKPLPFKCSGAAKAGVAIAGAAVAGIVLGGVAVLLLAAFGAKKGFEHWRDSSNQRMTQVHANPLYVENPNVQHNPLYVSSTI